MDVTRSEIVPAVLRLLADGSPVTGADIVLDIRRAGDGFVVDWADGNLKALGSVGTRYLTVAQVSATDHPGLYQALVDLGAVGGIVDNPPVGDTLIVTYYEMTAGPVYTPLDDERWRVVPSPLDADTMTNLVSDALAPIMGTGFTAGQDDLHSLRARGDAAWATPATVVLTDASLTAAKIGAGFVSTIQSGLAVPGSAMTLTAGERDAVKAAVWATATDDGLYTYGEALSRLHRRQRHPYKLLANGTLQYLNAAGSSVEASRTILDVSGGAITAPGAGEPARASIEVDT